MIQNPDQATLLSRLRNVQILNLDYIFMDHDFELANLIPEKFNIINTLNITIECDDADFEKTVKRHFTKLRDSQKSYQLNICNNHLLQLMGRHQERYLRVYENDLKSELKLF